MSELLKQRRESNESTLLSKSFSKEMQEAFKEHNAVYKEYDRLISSEMTYLPTKARPALLENIDKSGKQLEKVQPQDKLDEILIEEMAERLAIMKNEVLVRQNNPFSYEAVIRSMGLGMEDIKSEEKKFLEMDIEKTLERWPEINGQSYAEKPNNEEEISQVKKAYIKLLEKSYEIAADMTIEGFPTFSAYMHRKLGKSLIVNFNSDPEGRSSESFGIINLGLYNPRIIQTVRGYSCERILNLFDVAEIVGEEGVVGHQGQSLITMHSSIPDFLKVRFLPAAMVSAESLGKIGANRMVQELIKDPGFVDGIGKKDFEFLRDRFDMSEKHILIERFMCCYQSHLYFQNGKDAKLTAEAMRSVFKSPALTSEEHENLIRGYYNSEGFWKHYEEYDIEIWGYITAYSMTEKILKRLSVLNEDESRNVFGNLQIGHWTKKGFEKYFDYLVENSKNNSEDLSESRRK
jgi:hypothetical protein